MITNTLENSKFHYFGQFEIMKLLAQMTGDETMQRNIEHSFENSILLVVQRCWICYMCPAFSVCCTRFGVRHSFNHPRTRRWCVFWGDRRCSTKMVVISSSQHSLYPQMAGNSRGTGVAFAIGHNYSGAHTHFLCTIHDIHRHCLRFSCATAIILSAFPFSNMQHQCVLPFSLRTTADYLSQSFTS